MRQKLLGAVSVMGLLFAGAVRADVPKVAVDISPVHSLVARVMGDLGSPEMVMKPGATPHGYAMRPSEARALSKADLVIWVGPSLTPWLDRSIGSVAAQADQLILSEVDGNLALPIREGARYEAHDHAHDEHGHDDHDEHAHEEHGHDDHEEHAHDEQGHDEHAGGIDPHFWLDPVNGIVWLEAIAEALSAADPANAAQYHANAEAGAAEIETVMAETLAQLASLRGEPFIVFHDAYQYFENRMGVFAAGAISVSDASEPGPARLAEIRETVTELGVSCIFAEPQFNPRLVRVVAEGSGARSAILDPQGLEIEMGADLYPELIRRLGRSMQSCLSES